MHNLKHRSLQKEMLDADDIPFEAIKKNLQELNIINSWLGGHRITLKGLKYFIQNKASTLSICELGCGGGDNLKIIHAYAVKHKIPLQLTGIDIKEACIQYAVAQNPDINANWICSDYKKVAFSPPMPDVLFSSLFCHHFKEDELVFMLRWMNENSSKGFFINDLQRHPVAYYAIKWITLLFSRSVLVKNDAPLSVARGFTRNEWESLFKKAGIAHYRIQWQWAFRYLIICKK